jgi:hypothetical protein
MNGIASQADVRAIEDQHPKLAQSTYEMTPARRQFVFGWMSSKDRDPALYS